ncbi:heme ABC transporter ATP-binding protein [Endozoicomonas sp. G2_1]|uniref:heme ABC transporter ATP-binding protein n=1 Tax=Endozoicomonas sp. G2_1 TaxID=2821091 RepID=UPI001ADBD88C|nr:heme ABC transporter ATP-binding protein [Endozoicomonas sp. G2_1]
MVSQIDLYSHTQRPVLAFQNIQIFRGKNQVVRQAGGAVHQGELVALIGENGAGKSTLLHALAGQMSASGNIEFLGQDIASWPVDVLATKRAVLNQHTSLPFAFTVPELVAMGRYQIAETNQQRDAKVEQYLACVGLAGHMSRTVNQLSGGELQRLQFARCLAQLDAFEPNHQHREDQSAKLMLLDEPTAALDLRHQHSLLQAVKAFTEQGNSAVIAIHDLNLAALYADKIMLLKDGVLAHQGSPSSVLTADILTNTYQTPINVMPYPNADAPMVYSAVAQGANQLWQIQSKNLGEQDAQTSIV